MWCLWNGEYGEHDIAGFYNTKSSSQKNIDRMNAEYEKWPGTVVGDFTCEKVEYDWGRRDQRWTVKCNLCGKIVYQYHAADWRRGKGRKTTCDCRLERKRQDQEKTKNDRLEKIAQNKKDHLGKTYDGWKVVEYNGFQKCKVECCVCGETKQSRIDVLLSGDVVPCAHNKKNDYSGNEWIGRRTGHLTVIGRDCGLFVAKCDCGREILERPTILFSRKTKTTCGDPDCEYSTVRQRDARKKHTQGHEYERQIEEMLRSIGYNAKRTKCFSDFGVDIVITDPDGTKTAVQCKMQGAPAGVNAVQEVYAGGRFYGCTKFSVICEKGFSNPTIIMAKKLGVYLCSGEYAPPDDIAEYSADLLPVFHSSTGNKKLYEINGESHTLADWCGIHGASISNVRRNLKCGMSLETALTSKPPSERKQYTVRGFTGNRAEICVHFGVLYQTVYYRMKHNGMTFEEAIFAQKKTVRPGQGNGLSENETHS